MDDTLNELLEGLAAPRPTPAGGAAAALTLAEAQALGLKVVRVSARFTRLESLLAAERELSKLLETTRPQFRADCAAVDSRRESVEPLIRIPLEVLGLARETLERLAAVLGDVKPTVLGDAAAAASLARAAADISYWNVRNNVSWGTEPDRWRQELETAVEHHAAAARAFDVVAKHVHRLLS